MRLLVVHPRTAGDVLRTTPAVAALRRRSPDARIAFAVEDRFADVLAGNPDIDETIAVPYEVVRHLETAALSAGDPALPPELHAAFAEARDRLRGFGADRAYNVAMSREGAWLARLSGAETVGFAFDAAGEIRFVGETPEHAERAMHRRDQVNRIRFYLLAVGAEEGDDALPRAVVSPAAREEAARLLAGDDRPVCAVQPGAGSEAEVWAIKRTPPEELSQLAARIEADGLRIVLVGSAAERERADIVAASCRSATNLAGRTSWGLLAALLERAALYVGHDSGPTHLACALGRPALAVFFGTSPVLNAAVGAPSLAVQADLRELFLCRGGIEAYAEALRRTRAPVLYEAVRALDLLAGGAETSPEGLRDLCRRLARVRRAGLAAWRDGRIGFPVLEPDLAALAAAGRGVASPAGAAAVYLGEVSRLIEKSEVGFRAVGM